MHVAIGFTIGLLGGFTAGVVYSRQIVADMKAEISQLHQRLDAFLSVAKAKL